MQSDWLQVSIWGNTAGRYLLFLGLLLLCFAVLMAARAVFRRLLSSKLAAPGEQEGLAWKRVLTSAYPAVGILAVYLSMLTLRLEHSLWVFISRATVLLTAFFVTRLLVSILEAGVFRYLEVKKNELLKSKISRFLLVIKLLVYTIVLLFVISNMGFNITSIITGLGIGGIAIAFAAQNLLGDFLSYFSILIDQPFVPGDFIIVDQLMGTVEHVGIKTTRIRSLWGEEIIFSNRDLINSRIRNFKDLKERRVVVRIGIEYSTPTEILAAIPGVLKELIDRLPMVRFDRAHFAAFGASSLDFEMVYYILTGEYNQYMDIQQSINLDIRRRFDEMGVRMAIPAQKLYVEKSQGGPL